MNWSILTVIAILIWIGIISSKWGKKTYSYTFRLSFSLMLLLVATITMLTR